MKTLFFTRSLAILMALVAVSAAIATADPIQPLPLANGTPVEALTTAPISTGSGTVKLVVQKPIGWLSETSAKGLLLTPVSNPGDVGALAIVLPLDNALSVGVASESALAVLDGWATDVVVSEHLPVVLKDGAGEDIPSTLMRAHGRFDDGRHGHFFILHASVAGGVVVLVAGASDEVFGPFEHTLRDLILSTVLQIAP